jgi:hypothetical protein
MRWTGHRTIGLQYGVTALVFLLVGFLLMLVMRWQLAWPTSPLPPLLAAAIGEHNAPSGYMLPEFYNQLVAMHGTVMIFLAVVPLLAGAFGNYIVPLQIGAREMAFPRLNAASFWLYFAAGLVSLVSFFVPMGAANSGWTSYPPLAVLATQGQDYWLVAIFLLGVSSALNAINMIATIVQLRADGVAFSKMSFFVWAQVTAVTGVSSPSGRRRLSADGSPCGDEFFPAFGVVCRRRAAARPHRRGQPVVVAAPVLVSCSSRGVRPHPSSHRHRRGSDRGEYAEAVVGLSRHGRLGRVHRRDVASGLGASHVSHRHGDAAGHVFFRSRR